MWIPEFLMVYKIRGGGRAGGVMSRVGNDRGELDRGGRGRGGEVRWESAGGGGGGRLIPCIQHVLSDEILHKH